MNKQEIIAILRSAPSREIKFPGEEPKFVKTPTIVWLEEQGMVYSVLEDGTIDVAGNINMNYQSIKEFPVDFSMCVIDGYFACTGNNLTSLKGCPKIVHGIFDCAYNHLENLKHISRGCTTYYTDFGAYNNYSDIPNT